MSRVSLRPGALAAAGLLAGQLFTPCQLLGQQPQEDLKKVQRDEVEDYYTKWLDEDVIYIISDEERDIFSQLTTDEEKEQFIEQFWQRRDPDIRTANNEFREEHYRRVAYVNENYSSGVPGWKTDRGRVYILHGEPDQKETYSYGQSYERELHEGGGRTAVKPFEKWWYRNIKGLGDDIEIEFVDPTGSGEFRLALTPWEKDALLLGQSSGANLAEAQGLYARKDHPYFQPDNMNDYQFMNQRIKDNPFIRYETIAHIQAAPGVEYDDLKELVQVDIGMDTLPLRLRKDYFQLNEEKSLVPVTVELDNKDLNFVEENGVYVARVAVYGLITTMTNRLVGEFGENLVLSYQPDRLNEGILNRSVYQKVFSLENRMRYRLDLAVKDLNSGKTGLKREGIILPRFEAEKLASSSLLLADLVRQLPEIPTDDEMFVIGDVKVRPSLKQSFAVDDPFWVYLHLYNAKLDQTSLQPALSVKYRILRGDVEITSDIDRRGESVQFFSGQRVVLVKSLPLRGLDPGEYRLEIDIEDLISGETHTSESVFNVEGSTDQ